MHLHGTLANACKTHLFQCPLHNFMLYNKKCFKIFNTSIIITSLLTVKGFILDLIQS